MTRGWIRRPLSWRLRVIGFLMGGAFVFAPSAGAENRCSATVTRGGKKFELRNCAVAYHSSEHSVMIWLTETPLSSGEEWSFQGSAFAPERDIHGKYLTMMSLAFCSGGGSSTPDPADVKSVKVRIHTADTRLLAHWVMDPSKSKDWAIEKMSISGWEEGSRENSREATSPSDLPVPGSPNSIFGCRRRARQQGWEAATRATETGQSPKAGAGAGSDSSHSSFL